MPTLATAPPAALDRIVHGRPMTSEQRQARQTALASPSCGPAIAIDGHTLGIAPLDPQQVAAGPHVVAITRRGRVPIEKSITLSRSR